ncbi:M949_RS01915 family surface polysaccharide biosynthesis protein [Bernardetia sp.]|uniref:M949_RS01915 family surface polysaccharide biosynthesis protein n=1 Tax=Bernardetia sp. TaxID=1937974 RepID=UPI0025C1AEC8|nr:hypothetical protein [Bernardetia sp.]
MTRFNSLSRTSFYFCLLISLLFFTFGAKAQNTTSKKLSKEEINSIFTTERKADLAIHYPIFQVHTYSDKKGKYYIVLSEYLPADAKAKDAISKVQEVYIKYQDGKYTRISETNNHIREEQYETGVWFWTKFLSLEDLNSDGEVDPIIVFGSVGMNKYDDGRINFIIHHKEKKVMIYHQNGVLDSDRYTNVDASFYELPISIQNKVKEMMVNFENIEYAIFPAGWKEAMAKKRGYFDEN